MGGNQMAMKSWLAGSTAQPPGRRRLLKGTAAAGAGAALLAACGGGSSKNESTGTQADKSGLVAKITDTTKEAKRGGVLKASLPVMVVSLDPHFQSGTILATL